MVRPQIHFLEVMFSGGPHDAVVENDNFLRGYIFGDTTSKVYFPKRSTFSIARYQKYIYGKVTIAEGPRDTVVGNNNFLGNQPFR